jgi:hypothetical protein
MAVGGSDLAIGREQRRTEKKGCARSPATVYNRRSENSEKTLLMK